MKKMLIFSVLLVSLLFLVSCVPASESETSEPVAGQAITSDLVTCNKNIVCKSAYNKCVTTTCAKITDKKAKAACADNCLKQAKLLIKKTSTSPTPSSPPAQDQASGTSSAAPTCASTDLNACTTESSCRGIGMSWCVDTSSTNGGYCSASACPSASTPPPPSQPTSDCFNRVRDGNEMGVDCGGSCFAYCKWTVPPNTPSDPNYIRGQCRQECDRYITSDPQYFNWCLEVCNSRRNRTETCIDGIKNNDEIGVDCGGPFCPSCPVVTTSSYSVNGCIDTDNSGTDSGNNPRLFGMAKGYSTAAVFQNDTCQMIRNGVSTPTGYFVKEMYCQSSGSTTSAVFPCNQGDSSGVGREYCTSGACRPCTDADHDGYGVGADRSGCLYPGEDCNDNPNTGGSNTNVCGVGLICVQHACYTNNQ
ncbi:hypothetical protein J4444_03670 [Candidatus Woesearchaeota archaeon]|nr:hypothetical protein [Candidatus Woesearchaeota archaeon]